MYNSGTPYDLEIRLHEFAANTGDLAQYLVEGQGYNLSTQMDNKLNREYIKKNLSFNIVSTGNVF